MNYGIYSSEAYRFDRWLEMVPAKTRLICFGNHDCIFDPAHYCSSREESGRVKFNLQNGCYVKDELVATHGTYIYLSPWTPSFMYPRWGFNADSGLPISYYWSRIPEETEILVTHGPPMGILDQAVPNANLPDSVIYSPAEHVGCRELAERIKSLKNLRLHVFGHIHGSRGVVYANGVVYINAAFLTESYQPHSQHVYQEIPTAGMTITGSTKGWFLVEMDEKN